MTSGRARVLRAMGPALSASLSLLCYSPGPGFFYVFDLLILTKSVIFHLTNLYQIPATGQALCYA